MQTGVAAEKTGLHEELVQLRREKAELLKALRAAMDCLWSGYRSTEVAYEQARDALNKLS